MDKEAKIRISLDGVSGVRAGLTQVLGDMTKMEVSASSISGTLKGMAMGLVRIGVDAAKAANDIRAIDFKAAGDKFKAYDEQISRMAVRGGKGIEELKAKFTQLGRQVGVSGGEFASAVKGFDRMTLSGTDESAEAVRTLGIYAQDTDRSLSEMMEPGDVMWNKLGIPAMRISAELGKLKAVADSTGVSMQALERATIRMSPQVARTEGGALRGSSMVAAAQLQGYSPEVAEENVQRMMGAYQAQPQHLVRRTLRQLTKNKRYEPYVRDPLTGRVQLKREAYPLLQKAYRRSPNPMGALMGVYGSSAEGLEAAQFDMNFDWGNVDKIERNAQQVSRENENAAEQRRKEAIGGLLRRRRGLRVTQQDMAAAAAEGEAGSEFSQTEAGQRIQRDLDRSSVDMAVGKEVQAGRDRRARSMSAADRATHDTVISAMPGVVQDVYNVGAAGVHALQDTGPANKSQEAVQQEVIRSVRQMPAAVERAIKGADLKVRENPLGQAAPAARVN